jgi:hypothetical protein
MMALPEFGKSAVVREFGAPIVIEEVCVAKLASVPEIREFRVDAAVLHGDVTRGFRD